MTQPPRRRPASSRTTASRPRRIAGRDGGPVTRPEVDESTDSTGTAESSDAAAPTDSTAATGPSGAARASEETTSDGAWASARLTTILLGVLALILVAGLALSGSVIYQRATAPDETEAAEVPEGQIAVPDGRPVIINELAWQEGVDAAAQAAQEIVAIDHQKYEAEVDAAAELMTDDFAATYRETAEDVREQIVERKTVVQATVAAQGVVRANETELQALIFLNQFVKREDEDGPTNVITPYKVLVTMVHTDQGWFVDSLDTDDRAPATGDQPSAPDGTEGTEPPVAPTDAPSPSPNE